MYQTSMKVNCYNVFSVETGCVAEIFYHVCLIVIPSSQYTIILSSCFIHNSIVLNNLSKE